MNSRVSNDIAEACENIGWQNIYNLFLQDVGINLGNPSSIGECRCNIPFPFSDDGRNSLSVNINTGLWRDFKPGSQAIHGLSGGNIVQFVALLNAKLINGKWTYSFEYAERSLRSILGLGNAPDKKWFEECKRNIDDSRALRIWQNKKPWNLETLKTLSIGYDVSSDKIVIPIMEFDGKIVSARFYNPNHLPKIKWGHGSLSGNIVIPNSAWYEDDLILVEGETDCISLRSLGFNAVSGTMGSSNPVPPGGWFVNKRVFICMDCDEAGMKARSLAASQLIDASAIFLVSIPEWEDRPENADISDYIMKMISDGLSKEDQIESIQKILDESTEYKAEENHKPEIEKTVVNVEDGFAARYIGTPLSVHVNLVTKLNIPFAVPEVVKLTCPAGGNVFCGKCPMKKLGGNAKAIIKVKKPKVGIQFVNVPDKVVRRTIMVQQNIPVMCNDLVANTVEYANLDVLQIKKPNAGFVDNTEGSEDVRFETYYLRKGDYDLISGCDYELEIEPVPNPSTQAITYYATGAKQIGTSFQNFEMDENKFLSMKEAFAHDEDVTGIIEYIRDYADDLANSVTGIMNRTDLHIAYMLVWFSQIEFYMRNSLNKRGWAELYVLGDTACGKTTTFRNMSNWFMSGYYSDRKHATAAGLIGAVQTSSITGDRYVSPGIMPMNDLKGPVLIDEFGLNNDSSLEVLALLASIRSEGMAVISKAGRATFDTRVRLIIASNPGEGVLLKHLPIKGVDIFNKFITQPEDRRRFDFAMAVCQDDVPREVLNTVHQKLNPKRSREDQINLLNWGRSRGPGRIKFDDSTYDVLERMSKMMCEKYDHNIGLVEPADQIKRIAKIAVSVATICFSTDNGENIIVKDNHIMVAVQLMMNFFDSQWFGYDIYSENIGSQRKILNEIDVRKGISITIHPGALSAWINRISTVPLFRRSAFNTMTPGQYMATNQLLQTLVVNNCVTPSVRAEEYRLTGQFLDLLKRLNKEISEGLEIYTLEMEERYKSELEDSFRRISNRNL